MSFIGQFLLSDVPGFESHTDALASFHYCQECSYRGQHVLLAGMTKIINLDMIFQSSIQ